MVIGCVRVTASCTRYRSIPYAVTKIATVWGGKYVPDAQLTTQGKYFELIQTLKMETRTRRGTT